MRLVEMGAHTISQRKQDSMVLDSFTFTRYPATSGGRLHFIAESTCTELFECGITLDDVGLTSFVL
jgi:hypothetical protein